MATNNPCGSRDVEQGQGHRGDAGEGGVSSRVAQGGREQAGACRLL